MIGGNQSRRGSGGCVSPQRGQGAAPLVGGSAPAFEGIENLKLLLSGRLYWPCMPQCVVYGWVRVYVYFNELDILNFNFFFFFFLIGGNFRRHSREKLPVTGYKQKPCIMMKDNCSQSSNQSELLLRKYIFHQYILFYKAVTDLRSMGVPAVCMILSNVFFF